MNCLLLISMAVEYGIYFVYLKNASDRWTIYLFKNCNISKTVLTFLLRILGSDHVIGSANHIQPRGSALPRGIMFAVKQLVWRHAVSAWHAFSSFFLSSQVTSFGGSSRSDSDIWQLGSIFASRQTDMSQWRLIAMIQEPFSVCIQLSRSRFEFTNHWCVVNNSLLFVGNSFQ